MMPTDAPGQSWNPALPFSVPLPWVCWLTVLRAVTTTITTVAVVAVTTGIITITATTESQMLQSSVRRSTSWITRWNSGISDCAEGSCTLSRTSLFQAW